MFIIQEIYQNLNQIKSWCDSQYINFETFKKFLDEYIELTLSIYSQKKNNNYIDQITSLEWMKKLKKSFALGNNRNNYDHIIKPFIQASPLNICLKTDFHDNFYHKVTNCCSSTNKFLINNLNLVENKNFILSYQVINNNRGVNIANIISKIINLG